MKTLIIGAGYVGLAIANAMLSQGDDVTVTTTSLEKVEDLKSRGFHVLHARLEDPFLIDQVGDYDRLLFTVAPRSMDEYEKVYLGPSKLLTQAKKIPPQVLYTSSTGVYGSIGEAWVDENTLIEPLTERQAILLKAEKELTRICPHLIILRLGGITGPGRELKNRLAIELPGDPKQPFNWVALEDIVGAALFTLNRKLEGIFNVISKEGMTRGESYEIVAKKAELQPPHFNPLKEMTHGGWKWVSNRKLRSNGYIFTGELH